MQVLILFISPCRAVGLQLEAVEIFSIHVKLEQAVVNAPSILHSIVDLVMHLSIQRSNGWIMPKDSYFRLRIDRVM